MATLGAAVSINKADAIGKMVLPMVNINRKTGHGGRLRMNFFPYELKLRHVFTVASYSRSTTPDVQLEITYDGITGYGEASMPQYLGQSVASVTAFLKKVDLGQFNDPFQ